MRCVHPRTQEKRAELETYAEEVARQKAAQAAQDPPDPESLVEPADALSRQLVALVAENAAIEDALYHLDSVSGRTD